MFFIRYLIVAVVCGIFITACNQEQDLVPHIDIQGHRGCRGLMPENTISGFIRALEMGVHTLEMDVCISNDHQVVVSHDPYFHHHISIDPQGIHITESTEKSHNLYELSYEDITQYDVGKRPHPRFPLQRKIPAIKPLLSQVIDTVEAYCITEDLRKVQYSIELKRKKENDRKFHPEVETFVDLVIDVLEKENIDDRIILQCFDVETLQIIRSKAPQIRLAYLVENAVNVEVNIAKLGFVPEIYSPAYKLVDRHLVQYCNDHNMQLIPWTVNEIKDLERLMKLGVHGIISDYPDKAIEIYESLLISQ